MQMDSLEKHCLASSSHIAIISDREHGGCLWKEDNKQNVSTYR